MGKFSDKFLNLLKVNDNEDYDEYDDYDDYDDYDEPKKVFKKSKSDDYYDDSEMNNKGMDDVQPKAQKPQKFAARSSKVVPMRTGRNNMEVCVIKPTSVEDAREITETLLAGRTVVLNLEGLDVDIAQRIIDFTSGSCFAISGNLQKISHYIFIITPASVDISGDFQEIFSGSFDVPSF